MHQMVEVAKTIDERGAQAQQSARRLHPALPAPGARVRGADPQGATTGTQLYKADPAGAHKLEKNYKPVYGTLNAIRQRRAQAQQEAYNDNAQRTAAYSRAEFDKFWQQEQARQPDRGRPRHQQRCGAPLQDAWLQRRRDRLDLRRAHAVGPAQGGQVRQDDGEQTFPRAAGAPRRAPAGLRAAHRQRRRALHE